VLEKTKVTAQVEAEPVQSSEFKVHNEEGRKTIKGYEIHMGKTTGDVGLFRIRRLSSHSEFRSPHSEFVPDGSSKENVWGTYIHGIFDNDHFRRDLINTLRFKRGYRPVDGVTNYAQARDKALDRWADILKKHIDIGFIDGLLNG
jgi:adenosylcobyric acid synthase